MANVYKSINEGFLRKYGDLDVAPKKALKESVEKERTEVVEAKETEKLTGNAAKLKKAFPELNFGKSELKEDLKEDKIEELKIKIHDNPEAAALVKHILEILEECEDCKEEEAEKEGLNESDTSVDAIMDQLNKGYSKYNIAFKYNSGKEAVNFHKAVMDWANKNHKRVIELRAPTLEAGDIDLNTIKVKGSYDVIYIEDIDRISDDLRHDIGELVRDMKGHVVATAYSRSKVDQAIASRFIWLGPVNESFKKKYKKLKTLKESWDDEEYVDLPKETEFNISNEIDVSSDMKEQEIRDIIKTYFYDYLEMGVGKYKYKFNSDGDLIVYDVEFLGPYDEREIHRMPLKIEGSDFEDYLGYWMTEYNYDVRDKDISYDLKSTPIEISYISQEEMDEDDLYYLTQLANKWLSLNGYLDKEVLIEAQARGGDLQKSKFKVSKGNKVELLNDSPIFVAIDMQGNYDEEKIFNSLEEAKNFAKDIIKENKDEDYSFYIYMLTEKDWDFYKDNGISVYDEEDPEEIIDSADVLGESLIKTSKKLKEDLAQDLTRYQKWVDYDMKKYGRISDITKKALEKAGLELVKDDHGDYEVIAKEDDGKAIAESVAKRGGIGKRK